MDTSSSTMATMGCGCAINILTARGDAIRRSIAQVYKCSLPGTIGLWSYRCWPLVPSRATVQGAAAHDTACHARAGGPVVVSLLARVRVATGAEWLHMRPCHEEYNGRKACNDADPRATVRIDTPPAV